MAWASVVTCSLRKGIAKTSTGGTSGKTPRLFPFKHIMQKSWEGEYAYE